MVWRKGRVSLNVRTQSLRRALVERHPIGLTLGNFAWHDRRKLLTRHGNRGRLPTLFFASAIVLRIARWSAIGVRDVEHGFLAPIIVQGCHPVRTAVHNRMLAGQVAPQFAQDSRKFFTRAGFGRRRGRILREPFS